jgi:hypothetical protein
MESYQQTVPRSHTFHDAGGVFFPRSQPSDPAASAGFSGTLSLTSDYDYRGFSQTAEDFAIQGGLDYGHDSGFYASAWDSSLAWGHVKQDSQDISFPMVLCLYLRAAIHAASLR